MKPHRDCYDFVNIVFFINDKEYVNVPIGVYGSFIINSDTFRIDNVSIIINVNNTGELINKIEVGNKYDVIIEELVQEKGRKFKSDIIITNIINHCIGTVDELSIIGDLNKQKWEDVTNK